MGLLAATLLRFKRVNAEEYAVRSLEVAYFTDYDTGEFIETWKNPVTGVTFDVPRTRMGPSNLKVRPEGLEVELPPGETRGLQLEHEFRPAKKSFPPLQGRI